MAYASVTYAGQTGSTTSYTIPFSYLNASDISVKVNGVPTSFTFTSSSVANISPAPTGTVVISRTTPIASKVTTFVDGSAFLASDTNNQNDQFLFAMQEATDNLGSAQASATAAAGSATSAASSATAAASSATAAAGSATTASSASTAAGTSATAASTQATNAANSATAAASSATAAAGSATAAASSATSASGSATTATTQASNAFTSATNAANSASAAATSASNAASSASAAATSAASLPNSSIGTGKVPQWNGSTWVGVTPGAGNLVAANNLSDVANAAAARTNLGLAIGTNVQAWNTDLDWVATNITASGKALLDDASVAAQRTTLGLGTAAVVNTGTGNGNIPLLDATGYPAINGIQITNLSASNIANGTVSPARMGSGTPSSSNYLRGDGAWAAVSSGALVFVASTSVGTGATFDVTGLASGYDYLFELDNVYPSADDNLVMRYQTGGSTWQTTSYEWVTTYTSYSSDATPANPNFDTSSSSAGTIGTTTYLAPLCIRTGNKTSASTTRGGIRGSLYLTNPGATGNYIGFTSSFVNADYTAGIRRFDSVGNRVATGAVTGLRMAWWNGNNFAGGTVNVYKIAKA